MSTQALPGFREFFPEAAARRAVIASAWREAARAFAFDEYDGPTLEPLALYAQKNAGGEEILGQVFRFEDAGGRQVALRPELTPTLARMAGAREKASPKPMKWFSIGSFFRHERQQRGRLREFLQWNCDILGAAGPAADAELIAVAAEALRRLGLCEGDFVVRVGHRQPWMRFLAERGIEGPQARAVLALADKLEREAPDALDAKLIEATSGRINLAAIRDFIAGPPPAELAELLEEAATRGVPAQVQADLSIVRGLAYYTGFVFEIFDSARSLRAIAGGGRYDGLLALLGGASLPAAGFGMGDVVLEELLDSLPHTAGLLAERAAARRGCAIYIVLADPSRRAEAFQLAAALRAAGHAVDMPLEDLKVGRQFQAAAKAGAGHAVVVGSEWPQVVLKNLSSRSEETLPHAELAARLAVRQAAPSR
ncbi:MAG: ATP phosphoribosyltransferase regulatory subunit [Terrimicrobiaceae bacterium]|nr:ATP phosphoribosyltransferase regulatory subunit [Terrimicrobiaceae bacterium]